MNQGYERHLTNDLDCDIVMRIREEDDDDFLIDSDDEDEPDDLSLSGLEVEE